MRQLLTTLLLATSAMGVVHAQSPANQVVITQCVLPTQPGEFKARVVMPFQSGVTAVPNSRVTLHGQKGAIHHGMTNIHGDVTLSDVAPGVYAMTAKADGVFACYSMHVLQPGGDQKCPDKAEIACALVNARQFETIVMPYVASHHSRDELTTSDGVLVKHMDRLQKAADPVVLSSGRVVGHLSSATNEAAEQMNVFLFKNRKVIGRAISNQKGRFEFEDLQPGVYSLVAVGPHGLAAVGFELVEQVAGTARVDRRGPNFVSLLQQPPVDATLDLEVIPMTEEEIEEVIGVEEMEEEEEDDDDPLVMFDDLGNPLATGDVPLDGVGAPFAGGGGGGFVGGGGGGGFAGGGGGSGGLGSSAGIAAIAGVAAAVSNDSDDLFVPQAASNVVPGPVAN